MWLPHEKPSQDDTFKFLVIGWFSFGLDNSCAFNMAGIWVFSELRDHYLLNHVILKSIHREAPQSSFILPLPMVWGRQVEGASSLVDMLHAQPYPTWLASLAPTKQVIKCEVQCVCGVCWAGAGTPTSSFAFLLYMELGKGTAKVEDASWFTDLWLIVCLLGVNKL